MQIDHQDCLFRVVDNKECGAFRTILEFARKLGLDRIVLARKAQWREDVLEMIVSRLVLPFSDLFPLDSNGNITSTEHSVHLRNRTNNIDKHIYQPLAKLAAKQEEIQKKLSVLHLVDKKAFFYNLNIFNVLQENWFIGLLTNTQGCPFSVEIFSSYKGDVQSQIKKLTDKYQLQSLSLESNRQLTERFSHVLIENRVYNDHQIAARIFLEMLSYYLEWHICYRLASYFDQNSNNYFKPRTFVEVLEKLKSIRIQRFQIADQTKDSISSYLDSDQTEIIAALGLSLKIFD